MITRMIARSSVSSPSRFQFIARSGHNLPQFHCYPAVQRPQPRLATLTSFRHASTHPQVLINSTRSHYYPLLFAVLIPIGIGSSALLLDSEPSSQLTAGAGIEGGGGAKPLDENEFMNQDRNGEERSRTSIVYRVIYFVEDYILEPLSTTTRFVHLVILFLPVILASPILLLEWVGDGSQSKGRFRRANSKVEGRERSSTRWWYRLLVAQMARAGPTFIKVSHSSPFLTSSATFELTSREHSISSSHSGLDREPIYSQRRYASCSVDYIRTGNLILSVIPNTSSPARLVDRLKRSLPNSVRSQ